MMLSPPRMLPPTYSLPPRRCPWPPGLQDEAVAPEDGGERDGLRNPSSGVDDAPGLNENEGRDAFAKRLGSTRDMPRGAPIGSKADWGRRPVVRGTGGAKSESRAAGKTKGGFGGGFVCENSGSSKPGTARSRGLALAGPAVGSTTLAGSQVVAMVHEPLRGNRMNVYLVRYGVIEESCPEQSHPFGLANARLLPEISKQPRDIARACAGRLTASERGSERQRLIATGLDAHLEGNPRWRRRLLKRRIFSTSSRDRGPPKSNGAE